MRCVDVGVYVHFLFDFDLVDAFSVDVNVLHRLVVGVFEAHVDCVAHVFAGRALRVLEIADLGIGVRQLILFFGLMLSKLAPRMILFAFTAAPPHLTTPFGLMNPTGPVVVFLVLKFFVAVLAVPDSVINFAFFLHFLEHLLEFVIKFLQHFDFLFLLVEIVDVLFVLFQGFLEPVLQLFGLVLEHVLNT